MAKFGKFVLAFVFVATSSLGISSDAQDAVGKATSSSTNCENCKGENCKDGKCDCSEDVVVVSKKDNNDQLKSTHVQTSKFAPQINGKNALLSTFRVRNGKVIACVSPKSNRVVRGKKKKQEKTPAEKTFPGYIQIYNADLELVNEFGLPFSPSALDIDKSGNMFVGGEGKVAKLSADGEIMASCESPNMVGVDMEELKVEIKEQLIAQQEQMKKTFGTQVEKIKEQIADLEEGREDDEELSKNDERRLNMLESQLKSYSRILDQQSEVTDAQVEARMRYSSRITAIATTTDDVYIATSARSGSGYEVYRFDHNFEQPQQVLKGLRGCCGQMDIHAFGDNLAVAENTKFNVAVYDREGEELSRFGKRLSGKNQGFGSCCNPMNVLCCENGDYLTAESSVGKIKRFNAEGEMVGYIGEAKIGGGCKHVAFGFDAQLDRYYVQHEDSNEICILNPHPEQEEDASEKPSKKSKKKDASQN